MASSTAQFFIMSDDDPMSSEHDFAYEAPPKRSKLEKARRKEEATQRAKADPLTSITSMIPLRNSSNLSMQDCLMIWKKAVQESKVQKSIEAEKQRMTLMKTIQHCLAVWKDALQSSSIVNMQHCLAVWKDVPQSSSLRNMQYCSAVWSRPILKVWEIEFLKTRIESLSS